MEDKTTFEARKKSFEEELEALGDKYDIALFAANIVFPNGEVNPVVKLTDLAKQQEEVEKV